jgi:hypothetical protein
MHGPRGPVQVHQRGGAGATADASRRQQSADRRDVTARRSADCGDEAGGHGVQSACQVRDIYLNHLT